ncbi:MAG: hypothetical protein HWD85_12910 [Flavobacteriaceae bacterium]|nr:hypothetical protein [Flavobacteriaceae bacterium]
MTQEEFFERLGIKDSFTPPISSGYSQLDKIINGGFSNEVVTIASRPGHGKTAFLFNLMMNFSVKQDLKGIAAFPRLSKKDFVLYLTSWVINSDVFDKEVTEAILEDVYPHFMNLSTKRVKTLHRILPLDEIFTMAENEEVNYIILDDYFRSYDLQHDADRFANDYVKIQEFIARKNISVFVSLLTSRTAEKRGGEMKPRLNDIYAGDLVSTYSHKVIQLYRPEEYEIMCREDGISSKGDLELMIQQNSKGRKGSMRFFFVPPGRIQEDINSELKSNFDREERKNNPY